MCWILYNTNDNCFRSSCMRLCNKFECVTFDSTNLLCDALRQAFKNGPCTHCTHARTFHMQICILLHKKFRHSSRLRVTPALENTQCDVSYDLLNRPPTPNYPLTGRWTQGYSQLKGKQQKSTKSSKSFFFNFPLSTRQNTLLSISLFLCQLNELTMKDRWCSSKWGHPHTERMHSLYIAQTYIGEVSWMSEQMKAAT